MNQENSDQNEEMRPEYDIRGGVRGKYFEEYVASRGVVTVTSGIVVTTNAGGRVTGIMRSFTGPAIAKSPDLVISDRHVNHAA